MGGAFADSGGVSGLLGGGMFVFGRSMGCVGERLCAGDGVSNVFNGVSDGFVVFVRYECGFCWFRLFLLKGFR